MREKAVRMGKLLSKIFGNKEMRILMLGLDAAGKTSILPVSFVNKIPELRWPLIIIITVFTVVKSEL